MGGGVIEAHDYQLSPGCHVRSVAGSIQGMGLRILKLTGNSGSWAIS
jgi:hypothetical protein